MPGSSRLAPRVFVLSPASCRGKRATLLLAPRSSFRIAEAVRLGEAELGDVFAFLSGLYFRGKLAYARQFARPPGRTPGVLIVTPNEGLQRPDRPTSREDLQRFALQDIDARDPSYTAPLRRDAEILWEAHPALEVVLLGSIATAKYAAVLGETFGRRLLFPSAFVGRGDMSRGGLLLRRASSGEELDYQPLEGSARTGPRPPRLSRPGAT